MSTSTAQPDVAKCTADKPTGCKHFDSKGHIELILGPMFSGKTTELLRRLRRYEIGRHTCLLIKHGADVRYSDCDVYTHDKIRREATSCETRLSEISAKDLASATIIGIDEGQFFEDLPDFCESMSNAGKIVIVSALSGTFERKLFESVQRTMPYAESWTQLCAICMECGRDAAFTKRSSSCTELVQIGGKSKYKALCRQCWFK